MLINRINNVLSFEYLRCRTRNYIKSNEFLINPNTIFIICLPATDYYYLPYFQLYKYKNVIVNFSYINSNTYFSRLKDMILRNSKYRKYSEIKYDKAKEYIFFFDGQYTICSRELRLFLKKKYANCKIIFHLGDLIGTKKGIKIDDIKGFADLVVTYDHNDADKNGLTYHSDPYSKLPAEMFEQTNYKSQILFYGLAKNRAKELILIYDKLKSSNMKCEFCIPDLCDDYLGSRPELANAKYTPYLDYLKRVQNTQCLLEIIQKGSRGCTFRTWEAVVYNKKLITNNPSIREEAFYNPLYIQVIDSLDSLDVDWITKDVNVDYGYTEQLSPKACFEFYYDELYKHHKKSI